MKMDNLPVNMLIAIANNLGDFDLAHFCQINQTLNKFCELNNKFWTLRIEKLFGSKYLPFKVFPKMRAYYKIAKRAFLMDLKFVSIRGKNQTEQALKIALKYDLKLTVEEVLNLCRRQPQLYSDLNDNVYASSKLLCSLIGRNEQEISRLLALGVHPRIDTLERLIDIILVSHKNHKNALTYYKSYLFLLELLSPFFPNYNNFDVINNIITTRAKNKSLIDQYFYPK